MISSYYIGCFVVIAVAVAVVVSTATSVVAPVAIFVSLVLLIVSKIENSKVEKRLMAWTFAVSFL